MTKRKQTKKPTTHPQRSRKKKTATKKGTNPLYVVTKGGRVVEEAHGFVDALVKKMGLAPALNLLENLAKLALENIKTLSALEAFNKWYSQILEELQRRIAQIEAKTQKIFRKFKFI